jgi:hypothetical protein
VLYDTEAKINVDLKNLGIRLDTVKDNFDKNLNKEIESRKEVNQEMTLGTKGKLK